MEIKILYRLFLLLFTFSFFLVQSNYVFASLKGNDPAQQNNNASSTPVDNSTSTPTPSNPTQGSQSTQQDSGGTNNNSNNKDSNQSDDKKMTADDFYSSGHSVNLAEMGLTAFGGPRDAESLLKKIMRVAGYAIALVSVIGLAVGGFMFIASAGDENMANKGKEIVKASIIGVSLTTSAYLIITLVQSIIYAIQ